MSFNFSCPYCNNLLQAEEDLIGKIADCPSCGKKIIIQRDDNSFGDKPGVDNNTDSGIKNKAEETLRKAFKLEKLEGFSFSRFMRQMFKHHSWEETKIYLAQGTPTTTPPIGDVDANWPAPWLFARVMILTLALYLLIIWKGEFLGKEYMLLPLLLTGVIGIPLAALLFFWEVNIPRNISIISLIPMMGISGFVSITVTVILNKIVGRYDAVWAGPIEETAKLLTMMLFMKNNGHKFKLNGLLIGAAVGTGFAIIETGGYVVRGSSGTMELRALLSPFMHIPWSAIVGFALWRVKTRDGFSFSSLSSQKFLPLFLLSIGLHMFWNSKLLIDELVIRTAIFAVIEYAIIIYLIQDGINEVRKVKNENCAPEAAKIMPQ